MATFYIHVEPAETEIVWWAETPDVAGLSLAAPTLRALRRLIDEASLRHLGPDTPVELVLVEDEPDTANPVLGDLDQLAPTVSVGEPSRRALASKVA
jgi:hypothetical protein